MVVPSTGEPMGNVPQSLTYVAHFNAAVTLRTVSLTSADVP